MNDKHFALAIVPAALVAILAILLVPQPDKALAITMLCFGWGLGYLVARSIN